MKKNIKGNVTNSSDGTELVPSSSLESEGISAPAAFEPDCTIVKTSSNPLVRQEETAMSPQGNEKDVRVVVANSWQGHLTNASRKERLVHQIAMKLRKQMDQRQFRCLASLLYTIGVELLSDEVGVVAFDIKKKKTRVIRQIPVCGATSLSHIPQDVLARSIVASQVAHVDSPGFADQCQALYFGPIEVASWFENDTKGAYESNKWSKSGIWLVFVPVWPSEHWKANVDERHWIYVVRPALVLSTAADDGSSFLCWELLRFGIEWFTWKHDRLETRFRETQVMSTHYGDLVSQGASPDRFVRVVCSTMIRPVRPEHLAKTYASLVEECGEKGTPLERGSRLWRRMKSIDDASSHCNGSVALGKNEALPFRCVGAGKDSVCPQTGDINRSNLGILQLFIWRSGFWKGSTSGVTTEADTLAYNSLMSEALSGLRWAASNLDVVPIRDNIVAPTEYISLKRGKDRTLLRVFLSRAISEGLAIVESHRECNQPVPVAKLSWLAQAAHLAVVLTTDQPWEPDAIRALIRVMAGYGHEILEVPSIIDLARHLRQTLRGESALHTLKQRYRDHFFHTVEVCLIGFALLRSRPGGANSPEFSHSILENCGGHSPAFSRITGQVSLEQRKELFAQWWVAALAHDTAYGIDVLKGTVDLLEYFQNHPAIGKFKKDVLAAILQMQTEMARVAPELESDTSILEGDHGVITASHLKASLEKYGQEVTQRFLPAIRAIAFHNTKVPSVNATRDPVAALLILCDTVQDWGRSQLGYERSPTVVLSRLVSPAPTPKDEQFGPVQRFSFSISPQPSSAGNGHLCEHVWENSRFLDITLCYSPRAARSPSVYFSWADTTHNLRRVDFSGWGVDLRITHSLPLADDCGTRMSEFAGRVQDLEAGFLSDWVNTACSGNPNAAILHEVRIEESRFIEGLHRTAPRFEYLRFNLLELNRTYQAGKRLMGISLKSFGEFCSQAFSRPNDTDADPPQRPPR